MSVLRDLLRWTVCLLRLWPVRLGRLLGVVAVSPSGTEPVLWLAWLHRFAWAQFDLVGGPELVELLWRAFTQTRRLTAAEIAVAESVLGPEALQYEDVRVASGGFLGPVFERNGQRAFATWHTVNLPAMRAGDLPLLVHELTHVLQYERVGSVYIGQGLWVQYRKGRAAYDYGGQDGLQQAISAGKQYRDYNREQQGQIAQDFCAHQLVGRETDVYAPFIAQLRQGLL
ncbi:MAG: DUF4157 domain-containing protein [Candidatus Promineifilaceae bacterium]|nr:DUF4157 domain-containing protein [Candidatus Promineifilaceae bacterium]